MTQMVSNEQISAVMDGEADGEICGRITEQPAAVATWQRYHLIGSALRHELPATTDDTLAGRIARALEQEPAHNAPAALPG